MSKFKVGDLCIYKHVTNLKNQPENYGKLFTLKKFVGKRPGVADDSHWEIDSVLKYNDGKYYNLCPEFAMQKLDNPPDDVVDEMLSITGKPPAVKLKEKV